MFRAADPYASFYSEAFDSHPAYGSDLLKPSAQEKWTRRRNVNVLPICTGIFVPWIAFSLIHAMLSFYVHEVSPPLCYAVQAIVCSILGLLTILALLRMLKRWKSKSESDWFLFLCSTTLLAVVIAMVFGNREFAASGQLFHDSSN